MTSASRVDPVWGIAHALRAVVGAVRMYEESLTRLVYQSWRERIAARTLAAYHRALLREFAPQAFRDGLRAGNVDEPPDEDEEKAISDWIADQAQYVMDFWRDSVAIRKIDDLQERVAAERRILERVGMWVRAMSALYDRGLAAAKENMMVTWRMGATEEHCDTCRWLNGKRRRLKWFVSRGYLPRESGSETLECGGYNCQCGLYADDGRRVM